MTILLILLGFAAGASEAVRLRMRTQELTVFSDALAALKSAAAYTSGDLRTLLDLCTENLFLRSVMRDKDPMQAWKAAAADFFTNTADKILACEFINGYGRADLNGLLAYITLFEERTAVQLHRAEKAVETKSKLYTVLGLFSGVVTALLLV